MKTFNQMAAQGDVLFVRVEQIPDGLSPMEISGDHYVLAHSETGHHHVIDRAKADALVPADDEFIAYVRVHADAGAEVVHKRSFDTHETLLLPPGNYQVRRQREYTPEGFRRAAD